MKKAIITTFLAFLMVCIFGYTTVHAEEVRENASNETELSKTFEKDILPYILDFLTVSAGVVLAITPILSKVTRARKTFDLAKENIEAVSRDNKAKQGEMANLDRKHMEEIAALIERQNELEAGNLEMQGTVEKLYKMCRIAFLNTPDLVRGGQAVEIARITEEADEEAEKAVEAAD